MFRTAEPFVGKSGIIYRIHETPHGKAVLECNTQRSYPEASNTFNGYMPGFLVQRASRESRGMPFYGHGKLKVVTFGNTVYFSAAADTPGLGYDTLYRGFSVSTGKMLGIDGEEAGCVTRVISEARITSMLREKEKKAAE